MSQLRWYSHVGFFGFMYDMDVSRWTINVGWGLRWFTPLATNPEWPLQELSTKDASNAV